MTYNAKLLDFCKTRPWLVVLLLFIPVEIFISPFGEFPLNDDWSYARAVERYVNHDEVFFPGWIAIPFVSQYIIGIISCKLFGFSFLTLRLTSIVIGLLTIFIFDKLLNRLNVNVVFRFFILLIFAFNPLFLVLANSFMPDIFTLFFAVCSFYFMIKYLQIKGRWNLFFLIFFTVFGTLTRQTGIFIPFIFGIVYFILHLKSAKNMIIAFFPFVLNFVFLFLIEMMARAFELLPRTYNLQLNAIYDKLSHFTFGSFLYIALGITVSMICLGLILLPLTISNYHYHYQQIKKGVLSKIMFTLFVLFLLMKSMFTIHVLPFNGNIFYLTGIGPLILTGLNTQLLPEVSLFTRFICVLLHLLGGISFYCAFYAILKSIFTTKSVEFRLIGVFFILLFFGYLIPISFNYANDRYLLFLIPFFLVSYWLAIEFKIQKALFYLAFIPIFLFSTFAMHDYFSIHTARWKALDDLTKKQHVSPQKIDGGFEFNAWYLFGKVGFSSQAGRWWFIADDMYIVSPKKRKGYRIESVYPFKSYLSYSFNELYVLKKQENQ